MTTQRVVRSVAVAAALFGGVALGAALGVPQLAGAAASAGRAAQAHTHGAKDAPGGAQLEAAAQALGIGSDELRADLQSGKTIAQVATDKGIDVNAVIDAMVAAAQPELRQHISDLVNNGAPSAGHGAPPAGPRKGPDLETAAMAIGISVDDLTNEFHAGKSIAQVAGEHNVDVSAVISAIVADHTARLDQAVAAGKLTQAQADARKADLTPRVTDLVNHVPGRHGPKASDSHGPNHSEDNSSTQPSSSSSSSGN